MKLEIYNKIMLITITQINMITKIFKHMLTQTNKITLTNKVTLANHNNRITINQINKVILPNKVMLINRNNIIKDNRSNNITNRNNNIIKDLFKHLRGMLKLLLTIEYHLLEL